MRFLTSCALIALAMAGPAAAQTAYTYEYDTLGRLVRVERGTGSSSRVRYAYDPADNRTKVKQGTSSPTANYDWIFYDWSDWSGYTSVLDNDADPDLPYDTFTITGVSGTHAAYATIVSGGADITFLPPGPGTYYFNYQMKDSDNNTSSNSVQITLFSFP